MVLKRCKITGKFRFFVDGTAIPSITKKLIPETVVCRLQSQGHSSYPDSHQGAWDLAISSRQVWIAWEVQGVDLPAWHLTPGTLASAGMRGGPVDSVNPVEENQQLPPWLGLPCLCSTALYGKTEKLSQDEESSIRSWKAPWYHGAIFQDSDWKGVFREDNYLGQTSHVIVFFKG